MVKIVYTSSKQASQYKFVLNIPIDSLGPQYSIHGLSYAITKQGSFLDGTM